LKADENNANANEAIEAEAADADVADRANKANEANEADKADLAENKAIKADESIEADKAKTDKADETDKASVADKAKVEKAIMADKANVADVADKTNETNKANVADKADDFDKLDKTDSADNKAYTDKAIDAKVSEANYGINGLTTTPMSSCLLDTPACMFNLNLLLRTHRDVVQPISFPYILLYQRQHVCSHKNTPSIAPAHLSKPTLLAPQKEAAISLCFSWDSGYEM